MQPKKESVRGVYSHYSNEVLLEAFEAGPERIKNAIEGLSFEELKLRPVENKWSILETVIHLAEAEIFGASRFRLAYCLHPGPLPFYKEAELAKKLRYQDQSKEFLEDNINLFGLLRQSTIPLLKRLTPDEWEITALHPERGHMTIRELLELYADHSERHLEQILAKRELIGKPLSPAIELILKDRLY